MRYIAFLRAINVGGHTVKMERLRTLFEASGFAAVETFIASGNVIFDSAETDSSLLEEQIERQLEAELGYRVDTFLRTPAESAAIAEYRPFGVLEPADDAHTVSVVMLKGIPAPEVQRRLEGLNTDTDSFHVQRREVYWLCRTSIARSKAGIQMGKVLGAPGTARNVKTIRRIAAVLTDRE